MTNRSMRLMRLLILSIALTLAAAAQDGGQLFTTYCSACHGTDGKGATGGLFPPLAGSPWLSGKVDRTAKIVLHGIEGPIDVAGKSYNLVMPPQGAVLPDDQLAAILTYVRSSWGNKESAVTTAEIAAIREATRDRTTPWTAKELLKLHPLPIPETPLKNLTSRIYHGNWQDLPDFTKLEANNIEEEHRGLISVSHADRKNGFGLVWEGDLEIGTPGKHTFRLDCDDGGRLVINGTTVAHVKGLGPIGGNRAREGTIKLSKGSHPIRIEYYELSGQEGIALEMKAPKSGKWIALSDITTSNKPKQGTGIPIEPTTERAAIYRNFIDGTTPRAIGIGLPGGVNFAYSADHLAPELLWTGNFMDGGRHWVNRGQGNQPPAGERTLRLTTTPALASDATFRGYQLDPAGNPTFAVTSGDLNLTDRFTGSNGMLVRTLTTEGKGSPLTILIAEKLPLEKQGDRSWLIAGNLTIDVSSPSVAEKDGKLLLTLTPGQPATLTYSWK